MPPPTPMLTASTLHEIRAIASELGFDHVSAVPPRVPLLDQQAYDNWCDDGSAADMGYMVRNAERRRSPDTLFPGIGSVLCVGVSYFQGPLPSKPGPGFGRVARYAWGEDYHDAIRTRLRALAARIEPMVPGSAALSPAVDTKPVLERALARSAGLGFTGKNTLLIASHRGAERFHIGSFLFLAELFLTARLSDDVSPEAAPGGCGGCTRCLTACPTGAFKDAFHLDAGRCIAYLTIENRGWIDRGLRPLMGDWLFGCDVCQDVCPFNARAQETRWPEFSAARGAGPWIALADILAMGDAPAFRARFGATPLSRPKRAGLVRNACVVAGNSSDEGLIPLLRQRLDDDEPVVRGHAAWALSRLMPPPSFQALANARLENEREAAVRAEWTAPFDTKVAP